MKTYMGTITEILSRTVEIQAETWEDAVKKLEQNYNNEEIVLTADDFVDVDFTVFSERR
ncbi:MAG: DpnD/PcfM family protein [Lachnospiraceae bacterium]|nr:DpnD/PcfM family protein [Lachnospiraceae bacterium]